MNTNDLIETVTDYIYYTSNIDLIEAEELAEDFVESIYG